MAPGLPHRSSASSWARSRTGRRWHAAQALDSLGIAYEVQRDVRAPNPRARRRVRQRRRGRGLEVIIAGAGGAAHLAGVTAARTLLPVLGVPIQSKALNGIDSLLSTVQMPAGIPVGTLAIGNSGATNAALLAAAILANKYPEIRAALRKYREAQTQAVLPRPTPRREYDHAPPYRDGDHPRRPAGAATPDNE